MQSRLTLSKGFSKSMKIICRSDRNSLHCSMMFLNELMWSVMYEKQWMFNVHEDDWFHRCEHDRWKMFLWHFSMGTFIWLFTQQQCGVKSSESYNLSFTSQTSKLFAKNGLFLNLKQRLQQKLLWKLFGFVQGLTTWSCE